MSKIHYYEFPKTLSAEMRFKNGARALFGICTMKNKYINNNTCLNCSECQDGWVKCNNFTCIRSERSIAGINISMVKKLMKKLGGYGYTQHFDRDGSLFETTKILLKGNNTKNHYNKHL